MTILGQLFGRYRFALRRIGGLSVILFGLTTLDVIKIPWFYTGMRAQYTRQRGTFAGSATIGVFFAASWSPCVGANIGTNLTLGMSQQTVGQAIWLTSGCSLGLGIPFLILTLGLEHATGWVRRMRHYQRTFQVASGILILIIGPMLLTNSLSRIAIWSFQNRWFIDFFRLCRRAEYLTAMLAGLLSFLSPCALPFVPGHFLSEWVLI